MIAAAKKSTMHTNSAVQKKSAVLKSVSFFYFTAAAFFALFLVYSISNLSAFHYLQGQENETGYVITRYAVFALKILLPAAMAAVFFIARHTGFKKAEKTIKKVTDLWALGALAVFASAALAYLYSRFFSGRTQNESTVQAQGNTFFLVLNLLLFFLGIASMLLTEEKFFLVLALINLAVNSVYSLLLPMPIQDVNTMLSASFSQQCLTACVYNIGYFILAANFLAVGVYLAKRKV